MLCWPLRLFTICDAKQIKGRLVDVALKIDISKAYDRVDWGYLHCMMLKMGFDPKWLSWILLCVQSINYSVTVNQDCVGPIHPSRGLRQDDPLSPYLFLIYVEGLSTLIKKEEGRGTLDGAKICRGAPVLSHLLFADDCFLFFQADVQEAKTMQSVLEVYARASGQHINMQKSEVFFSRNVPEGDKHRIAQILGVRITLGTGKYLGLPSLVGRNRKGVFSFIKDRVWQQINSWSSKSLSRAGREVLIKPVAQAIPSYYMSIYLLPQTFCDEIKKMLNSFWWGSKNRTSKGIKWLSWEMLSMRKDDGGMGFYDFQAFNLALLAKQGWKFVDDPNALLTRVFKTKYFPNGDFLNANLGHNPSYCWCSVWCSQSF